MSVQDTYLYAAPTKALRDWLRLQPGVVASMVGGPSATTSRIQATENGGLLGGGTDLPAIAFHARPGTVFDNTLHVSQFQFDCYGNTPENAEILASALASLLASTPPLTRLSTAVVFQGPAVIVDSFYLPVQINRTARQVLLASLTFSAF